MIKESATFDLVQSQTHSCKTLKGLFCHWASSSFFSFGREYFQNLFLQVSRCRWHWAGWQRSLWWGPVPPRPLCIPPLGQLGWPAVAAATRQVQSVPLLVSPCALSPGPSVPLGAVGAAGGSNVGNNTWPRCSHSVQVLSTFPDSRLTEFVKQFTDESRDNSYTVIGKGSGVQNSYEGSVHASEENGLIGYGGENEFSSMWLTV